VLGSSWVDTQLAASQEGLISKKLVGYWYSLVLLKNRILEQEHARMSGFWMEVVVQSSFRRLNRNVGPVDCFYT
jgi:hypothetical protein